MDGMVEENGTTGNPVVDPLAHSPGDNNSSVVVTSVQSVIQANQQSVIQTAANIQPVQLQKGNVILVSKPNSVIQTTQGSLQTLQNSPMDRNNWFTRPLSRHQPEPTGLEIPLAQRFSTFSSPGPTLKVVDAPSDDSLSNDDDSSKKRRDILTRRPSYRKILNDLGGGEIAVGRGESSSDVDTNEDSELSSHSIPSHYQTHTATVIPAGTIQIASQGETVQGLHTLTMTNATTAGGAIVQYAQGQDGQFFVPVVTQGGGIGGGPIIAEDQARKREMRLLKNREAARECRRKKKEYIKCLENRVAVLENQNKALIEELKSLKELYCQQKTD